MARILIVENDDSSAFEIRNGLTNHLHNVDVCKSGAQALRLLAKSEYDVAIVSWDLTDIDGPEICRRVSSLDSPVPILLLGSRPGVEDAIKGLDAGAQDFMSKPLQMAELSARVRSLLRRYSKAAKVFVAPVNPQVLNPLALNPPFVS